jgi:haloalkane dehalogenase
MNPLDYLVKLPVAASDDDDDVIGADVAVQTFAFRGRQHRYVDAGVGACPVVFLHGNPTNMLLWRRFIAALRDGRRVIAVDFQSIAQQSTSESIHDIAADEDLVLALLAHLQVERVVLVGHDWGVAIAAGLYRRCPSMVAGVCFFEGMLYPVSFRDYTIVTWVLGRVLQVPVLSTLLLVYANVFLRVLLPLGCRHHLSPKDHQRYASRFPTVASRRAIWRWVQTIPSGPGHPLYDVVITNREHLFAGDAPKLFFYARPGFATSERTLADILSRCRSLTSVDLGKGVHYFSEDQPSTMVRALREWLDNAGL